ncbi:MULTISPECIES: YcaO-like family protein [Streptomyces]|uniref:YcaO domain-containing protein n=4 Tax=Streptomyces scabiei TaxID=1930 RepID=C9Z183_STRSW|nr:MULTISPECIES: YcaO-like family protein [Streptomyces]MBP5863424.1 hypothetical protein [Streptomyces sp. LBUM 1484]MBP5876073.1 hypothetical protein [Streptomyces sp. LBUM 1477]MBP5883805.1 hypothetical protein [Streptomyces sp. LBUM 1487]MBP5899824.1 hypothetical protein [Streptomyces sp. LBUM 1488]MDW8473323.1 YcaO-like family protein [Streptomyces scabiei]
MREATATECELREVVHRSYPSEGTVTVRCTVRPAEGDARADGYGTATTEAVARAKALSEAVERLVACTPFTAVARPPTAFADPGTGSGPVPPFPAAGVRTAPDGCADRVYRPLTGGGPRRVPLYWSSPWTAGAELRAGTLTAAQARLSSTVGWAVAPTPEAALRGALLELTELIGYGVFLHRRLAGPPRRPSGDDRTLVVPLEGVGRTPAVLAVAYGRGRLMPATGLGCGETVAEATGRALLELAQAETMWRSNPTAEPAERFFLRRFERWPLLTRCATLDFDLKDADAPHGPHDPAPGDDEPRPATPLEELEAGGIRVWADSGALDISGPDIPRTRLCFAHVVSDPQPLLGLVRAGIPVFDTGEVRRTLDPSRPSADPSDPAGRAVPADTRRERRDLRDRSADRGPARRGREGRRSA